MFTLIHTDQLFYKLLSLFRPHQILPFLLLTVQPIVVVVSLLCVVQMSVLSLQPLASILPILHPQLHQPLIQFLRRHPHRAGNFRCGHAVISRQVLLGDGSLQDVLCQIQHLPLRQSFTRAHVPCWNVPARLTDLWQHLTGHPSLERPRLFQLGGEDESVETAFVDENRFLLVVRTSPLNQGSGFVFLLSVGCP